MGWYRFILTPSFKGVLNKKLKLYPLEVLVTDFTPSPYKVKNFVNGDRFEAGDKIKIETTAKLHSGGPYIDAESGSC